VETCEKNFRYEVSEAFLLIITYFLAEGTPSSIYSCSIGQILEHEFCHLGCWAVKEKFLKRRNFCLSMLLFGVFFLNFHGHKFNLNFFSHCSVRTKKLHKIKLKIVMNFK
jgi:hypothetical protein